MERYNSVTIQQDAGGVQPIYERPAIASYSDELILEVLGPARTLYACDPGNPSCR
jgi:hypothetical protein